MAQKWHSKHGTPIDCLAFLWFESLRVHHIINPQKCGFFLCSCGFSAFLVYANLAVSCGIFASMLHRKYTVKYPLPCGGTSVAPWRNFYMARLGAVFVFPSLPQKQPPAFPGKCAIIDPMLQVVGAPAEI